MPDTFREITAIVEERLEIRTLTHEYEILSCFYDADCLTPTELQKHSRASSTAFFQALAGLEAKGLIASQVNAADRRSHLYRLTEFTKQVLAGQWLDYETDVSSYKQVRRLKKLILYNYFKTTSDVLKIRHFTCEYQILLLLSDVYGLTNIEITDLVDVSPTKFNASLRRLTKDGLIAFENNAADRRRKNYFLTDRSKLAIEEWRTHMARWAAAKSPVPRADPGRMTSS